jgi:hypothetical protein
MAELWYLNQAVMVVDGEYAYGVRSMAHGIWLEMMRESSRGRISSSIGPNKTRPGRSAS